jgi:Domain of Unknown Function (DUF1080)
MVQPIPKGAPKGHVMNQNTAGTAMEAARRRGNAGLSQLGMILSFLLVWWAGGAQAETLKPGWVPLMTGHDLRGWTNPFPWGTAVVSSNEIHLTADRKFFLVTDRPYTNFVFEGEVLLPPGEANSGFMFRAQVAPKRVWGYQAEVDGDETRRWSGGLYDEGRRMWFISPIRGDAASEAAFRARAGEAFKRHDWNTYRITCQGRQIRIEVNGVVTTDIEDAQDAAGVIALQHHGEKGKVYRFRNLRVKELPATAP